MTLQVITYGNGRMIDLDGRITGVTVGGDIAKAYRTANVTVLNTSDGRKRSIKFENGKELRIMHDKKEIFRGIIFSHEIDETGMTALTAHDYNIYLTKNTVSVNYANKRADQMLSQLCKDFGIAIGTISNTGYVLRKHTMRGKTVFQVVSEALFETQRQTGRRYRMRNTAGKVELYEVDSVLSEVFQFRDGTNLISATYGESIEDMQTKVRLTGGDEKKPITAFKTSPLAEKYGVMQYYEHFTDIKEAGRLNAKASAMLDSLSRPKQSFRITSLGVSAVKSGSAVGIINEMTGIDGYFSVEADSHTFNANGLYTMSLTLTKLTG